MGRLPMQAPCLVDAALAYMVEDLIPNRPAACFELGMRLYPQLGIQGKQGFAPQNPVLSFPPEASNTKPSNKDLLIRRSSCLYGK